MAGITLSASVLLAPGDDGYLAFDAEAQRLHRLNASASLIAECCDGTRNSQEVCAEVAPLLGEGGAEACRIWIAGAFDTGLLSDGLRAEPDWTARALAERACELRDEGSVLAAFVCQWQAAQLAPLEPGQWRALGELAHIVGRRQDAREAYERYLEFHPTDAEIGHILVSLRNDEAPTRAPDRCIQQLYERFAKFYEDNMCGELDYQAPVQLGAALDRIVGSSTGLTVADLGCGTGLSGRVLRDRARRLVGVDLSPDMIAEARATTLYDELDVAEVTTWLTRDDLATFDLIVACDTLIYFGDLRQVLVPAWHRLASRGWVAFTVERSETPQFRITDSGRYQHHPDHVREAAMDAGFRVTCLEEAVLRYEYDLTP